MSQQNEARFGEVIAVLNLFPIQRFYHVGDPVELEVCYTMIVLMKYTTPAGVIHTRIMQAVCRSFSDAVNLKAGFKMRVN